MINKETTIVVHCDGDEENCGADEYLDDSATCLINGRERLVAGSITRAKIFMRQSGWSFGKLTLCPSCNGKGNLILNR